MVKPAWGKKRVCTGCSVRFYDLNNPTPTCPKCGTAIDVNSVDHAKQRSVGIVMDTLEDLSFTAEDEASTDLDQAVLDEENDFDNDLASISQEEEI